MYAGMLVIAESDRQHVSLLLLHVLVDLEINLSESIVAAASAYAYFYLLQIIRTRLLQLRHW